MIYRNSKETFPPWPNSKSKKTGVRSLVFKQLNPELLKYMLKSKTTGVKSLVWNDLSQSYLNSKTKKYNNVLINCRDFRIMIQFVVCWYSGNSRSLAPMTFWNVSPDADIYFIICLSLNKCLWKPSAHISPHEADS